MRQDENVEVKAAVEKFESDLKLGVMMAITAHESLDHCPEHLSLPLQKFLDLYEIPFIVEYFELVARVSGRTSPILSALVDCVLSHQYSPDEIIDYQKLMLKCRAEKSPREATAGLWILSNFIGRRLESDNEFKAALEMGLLLITFLDELYVTPAAKTGT